MRQKQKNNKKENRVRSPKKFCVTAKPVEFMKNKHLYTYMECYA